MNSQSQTPLLINVILPVILVPLLWIAVRGDSRRSVVRWASQLARTLFRKKARGRTVRGWSLSRMPMLTGGDPITLKTPFIGSGNGATDRASLLVMYGSPKSRNSAISGRVKLSSTTTQSFGYRTACACPSGTCADGGHTGDASEWLSNEAPSATS